MKRTTWIILLAIIFFSNSCANGQTDIQSNIDIELNVKPIHARKLMESIVSIQPPRNYRNRMSLEKTANIISVELAKYGYEPKDQMYPVNQLEYKNVHAFYNNTNLPRLVIGAHYDVYGNQQGADDNASGVVGLLLLAKLFKDNRPNLPYCVEFVFYTLEEPPFFRSKHMGSYIHASSLSKDNVQVIGMVSIEMIGFFSNGENSQEYPIGLMKLFYPSKGDFIAVVGNYSSSRLVNHYRELFRLQNIRTESLKGPSFITGVDFSDHLNYWKFDYPGIMITDTSFYRNPNYHRDSDTMDTINFGKMLEVIKGIYGASVNIELRDHL